MKSCQKATRRKLLDVTGRTLSDITWGKQMKVTKNNNKTAGYYTWKTANATDRKLLDVTGQAKNGTSTISVT